MSSDDNKVKDIKTYAIKVEDVEEIIFDLDCEIDTCIKILADNEDNS